MGLYDKIEYRNTEYQTKDFYCQMEHYKIVNGRLFNQENIDLNYHGYVHFGDSENNFIAKFTDGDLVETSNNGILQKTEYKPYFGWCDVDGCKNEGCSGGMAWRESGYWTVCRRHSNDFRNRKSRPKMKQTAIDRENTRDKLTGELPH